VVFDHQGEWDPAVRRVRIAVLDALRRRGTKLETAALWLNIPTMRREPGLLLPNDPPLPGVALDDQVRKWVEDRGDAVWFVAGQPLPHRRTVVVERSGDVVRVSINGFEEHIESPAVEPPNPRTVRFPVFSAPSDVLLARGDTADELVLHRIGDQTLRLTLPGPVLAAKYLDDRTLNNGVVAVIQDGERMRMHLVGGGSDNQYWDKMVVKPDFEFGDVAATELSPLHLDLEFADLRYNFRWGGRWRQFHFRSLHPDQHTLDRSYGSSTSWPYHGRQNIAGTVFGPEDSMAIPIGNGVWSTLPMETTADITAAPGEHVIGMTTIDDEPFLVVGQGYEVRLRGKDSVRTLAEVHTLVAVAEHRPWLAISRSPQLIEVLDLATGQVIDELRAG
jgi:hypothetical protein